MLPQGMANSPTMCQVFVSAVISPLREQYSRVRCIHYMDDNLLSNKDEKVLDQAYEELIRLLRRKQLFVAPDNVQKTSVVSYLVARLDPLTVVPQKIEIRKDNLKTMTFRSCWVI